MEKIVEISKRHGAEGVVDFLVKEKTLLNEEGGVIDAAWTFLADQPDLIQSVSAQNLIKSLNEFLTKASIISLPCLQVLKILASENTIKRTIIFSGLYRNLILYLDSILPNVSIQHLGLEIIYILALDGVNRRSSQFFNEIGFIFKPMEVHATKKKIQITGSQILQLMVLNDECKPTILSTRGVDLCVNNLVQFSKTKEILLNSLKLLGYLAYEVEIHSSSFNSIENVISRVIDSTTNILNFHKDDAAIQSSGVSVLNSLTFNAIGRTALAKNNVFHVAINAIGCGEGATYESICLMEVILCNHDMRQKLHIESESCLKEIEGKLKAAEEMYGSDNAEIIQKSKHIISCFGLCTSGFTNVSKSLLLSPEENCKGGNPESLRFANSNSTDRYDLFQSDITDNSAFAELDSEEIADEKHKIKKVSTPLTNEAICASDNINSNIERKIERNSIEEIYYWKGIYFETKKVNERLVLKYETLFNKLGKLKVRMRDQHHLILLQNEQAKSNNKRNEANVTKILELEKLLKSHQDQKSVEYELLKAQEQENEKLSSQLGMYQHKVKLLEFQSIPGGKSSSNETVGKEMVDILDSCNKKLEKERDQLIKSLENSVSENDSIKLSMEKETSHLNAIVLALKETIKMQEEDFNSSMSGVNVDSSIENSVYKSILRDLKRPSEILDEIRNLKEQRPDIKDAAVRTVPDIDVLDIEKSLQDAFTFLKEGNKMVIHISRIRRFIQDIGLIELPLVIGDIDLVLGQVISSANNVDVLKIQKGKSNTFSMQTIKKRKTIFRYLSCDMFCESITLLGAKRFPKKELIESLYWVIEECIKPHVYKSKEPELAIDSEYQASFSALNETPVKCMRKVCEGVLLHLEDFKVKELDLSNFSKLSDKDILHSMLEMLDVFQTESKAIKIIHDFYFNVEKKRIRSRIQSKKCVEFEVLLCLANDFEIIPAFLNRNILKKILGEVTCIMKTFEYIHKFFPCPSRNGREICKFQMILARIAVEWFHSRREYDTPLKQIIGLLQWMDHSDGKWKMQKKDPSSVLPKFSSHLYQMNIS